MRDTHTHTRYDYQRVSYGSNNVIICKCNEALDMMWRWGGVTGHDGGGRRLSEGNAREKQREEG